MLQREVQSLAKTKKIGLQRVRQRVRSKLLDSRIASNKRKRKADEEIVVQIQKSEESRFVDLETDLISDERRRRIASALVMIGALMGLYLEHLSYKETHLDCLILQYSKALDSLDIHGFVLDEDGEPVANVTIELVDPESDTAVKNSISDEYGRYVIDAVLVKEYELHVSKSGYETVILTFKPEPLAFLQSLWLKGKVKETKDELSATEGWSMENAVALATFEGIFTIACALVGVHASFEIKRKKRYRRTQAFCWVGLFSRGLIIFGPALILLE